jgi:hypothetical protein
MKPVTKRISFEDLFPKESSRKQRVKRWNEWMALVAGEPEIVEYWGTPKECLACPRHCKKSDWCDHANLPPSVNPVMSFSEGLPSFACSDIGKGAERFLSDDYFNAVVNLAEALGYIKVAEGK